VTPSSFSTSIDFTQREGRGERDETPGRGGKMMLDVRKEREVNLTYPGGGGMN
jgi:hypothetical protein